MSGTQSPQENFRVILLTVVGQAFAAAGYTLEERPIQWSGGLFRFAKLLDDDIYARIEFQLLAYADTMWAARQPSRFRATLIRGGDTDPIRRDLSALVVEDFGVAILPSADYWWEFRNTDDLGKALAEAGHLIVGYGIPWLSGDIVPPSG
jgi:hypothetical protein